MGSVADPYDNALAESFVATLKRELLDRRPWPTREEVRTAIFEFVEVVFYNRQRIHCALGYLRARCTTRGVQWETALPPSENLSTKPT